jgi:predicted nucleotidyltransferase
MRAFGVTGVYLFGSTARDEALPDSDLDIFVEYDSSRAFSLLDLLRVKHLVEDAGAPNVDITTRKGLHPVLREAIEHEAIRIF